MKHTREEVIRKMNSYKQNKDTLTPAQIAQLEAIPGWTWEMEPSIIGEPLPKIVVICPKCKSANVSKDATAKWDVKTQDWELEPDFYGDFPLHCGDCDYMGNTGTFDERPATAEELEA